MHKNQPLNLTGTIASQGSKWLCWIFVSTFTKPIPASPHCLMSVPNIASPYGWLTEHPIRHDSTASNSMMPIKSDDTWIDVPSFQDVGGIGIWVAHPYSEKLQLCSSCPHIILSHQDLSQTASIASRAECAFGCLLWTLFKFIVNHSVPPLPRALYCSILGITTSALGSELGWER